MKHETAIRILSEGKFVRSAQAREATGRGEHAEAARLQKLVAEIEDAIEMLASADAEEAVGGPK